MIIQPLFLMIVFRKGLDADLAFFVVCVDEILDYGGGFPEGDICVRIWVVSVGVIERAMGAERVYAPTMAGTRPFGLMEI